MKLLGYELQQQQTLLRRENERRATVFFQDRIQEISSIYKDQLDSNVASKILLQDQLNQFLSESKDTAVHQFSEVCSGISLNAINEWKSKLLGILDSIDEPYNAVNVKELQTLDNVFTPLITKWSKKYESRLQSVFIYSMTREELLLKHQEIEAQVTNKLHEKWTSLKSARENESLQKHYNIALKSEINSYFKTFAFKLKSNEERELEDVSKITKDCIDEYICNMKDVTETNESTLTEKHELFATKAINSFLTALGLSGQKLGQQSQKPLKLKIDEIYSSILLKLKAHKEDLERQQTVELEKTKIKYSNLIAQLLESHPELSEQELEKRHLIITKALLDEIRDTISLPTAQLEEFEKKTNAEIHKAFCQIKLKRNQTLDQTELKIANQIHDYIQVEINKLKAQFNENSTIGLKKIKDMNQRVKETAKKTLNEESLTLPLQNKTNIFKKVDVKLQSELQEVQLKYEEQQAKYGQDIMELIFSLIELYDADMQVAINSLTADNQQGLERSHELCNRKYSLQLKLALKKYEDCINASEFETKLQNGIYQAYEVLKLNFERRHEAEIKQVESLKNSITTGFRNQLMEKLNFVTEESELLSFKNPITNKEIAEFESRFLPNNTTMLYKEKQNMMKSFEDVYHETCQALFEKQNQFALLLSQIISEVSQEFQLQVEKTMGSWAYLNEIQLTQLHESAKKEGLSRMQSASRQEKFDHKSFESRLVRQLDDDLQKCSAKNQLNVDYIKGLILGQITSIKQHVVSEIRSQRSLKAFESIKSAQLTNFRFKITKTFNLPTEDILIDFAESKLVAALDEARSEWESVQPSEVEIELALIKAKQSYHQYLEKRTNEMQFQNPKILQQANSVAVRIVTKEFESFIKQTPHVKMLLSEALKVAFNKYEDKNHLLAADLVDAAIGIDLGTTYSCVSIYRKGKTEMIPDRNNHKNTTPSYIQFKTKDEVIVGETAKSQSVLYPETTIFDAKRLIGRWFDDATVQNDMLSWPFKVVNFNKRPQIQVHGQNFFPEAISAKLLKKLKLDAEMHLGTALENAVITVPAYFSDSQKQATKRAGEAAGLTVLGILNEPTAAAIAYSLNYSDEKLRNVFVYDLGGGTFDVSVLVINGGKITVKAVDGDTHLGGSDFDNAMLKYCVAEFERLHTIRLTKQHGLASHNSRLQRIRHQCEKEKINLSVAQSVFVTLDRIFEDKNMHVEITRETFNRMNDTHFQKTMQIVEKALRESNLTIADINDVVLVGGSTRIPKIQRLLQQFFRNKPLNMSLNPDEVVARGAGIYAALLSGTKAKELDHIKFSDVSPLSLGIHVQGGGFSIIIPKNTTVPVSKTQNYFTVYNYQTAVSIEVYEGEESVVAKNNLLGKFTLDGIPAAPRGKETLEVTISIDKEGILTVTAKCKSNGINQHITIEAERNGLADSNLDCSDSD